MLDHILHSFFAYIPKLMGAAIIMLIIVIPVELGLFIYRWLLRKYGKGKVDDLSFRLTRKVIPIGVRLVAYILPFMSAMSILDIKPITYRVASILHRPVMALGLLIFILSLYLYWPRLRQRS